MEGRCGRPKKDGTPCQRPPTPNTSTGACFRHGGRACRGPDSGTFKHGRFSKYWGRVRGPLLAAKERADAEGSRLLDLKPGVALWDERVAELSQRLADADCPAYRQRLLQAWGEVQGLRGDEEALGVALDRLGALIAQGAEWDSAWGDLLGVLDRRAQRSEKALDLETKADRALTERAFLQLVGLVLTTIRTALPDVVPGAGPKHAAQLIDRVQAAVVLPMLGVSDAPEGRGKE